LSTRESSRYHEKKESDEAVTEHRRQNTNEEDADRPFSDYAVRGLECTNCVAGPVPVITVLARWSIAVGRIETGVKLLCSPSILLIQRMNQSGKNPDECQN
jgi:hypothetical protein